MRGSRPRKRYAVNGFTSSRRYAVNGFTLVEMLVSLFIFALLAAAGVAVLAFSVRAQEAASLKLADAATTERIGALLAADLLQAVPRVTRNARGDVEPAFRGGEGVLLLSYVRGGSRVQRVELRFEDRAVARVVFTAPDGGVGLPAQALAAGVQNARVRFREKGEWQDRWQSSRAAALPDAVELTVARNGEAPVTRLFLIGAGR